MLKKMCLLAFLSLPITPALAQPVQWRVEDGGNGHWYQVSEDRFATWRSAQAYAESVGGYLATLTSATENDLVASLAPGEVHLGGFQSLTSTDYSEPSGGWRWVTGEPWQFTAWHPGEPQNGGWPDERGEHFLTWWRFGGENAFLAQWNDAGTGEDGCCWEPSVPAAIEYSADCNNDGLIDKGQILAGQLPDANGNGVPDVCEPPICASWSLGTSPVLPAPRREFAMAFDEARGEIVLFGGGGTGPGPNAVWGDTWIFGAGAWHQYTGSAPSPRVNAALAFDRNAQRLVLFGGRNASDEFLNDTWEWTGSTWVLRATGGAPPRMGAGMAFDTVRGVLVLAGGATFAGNWILSSEVFEWNGSGWAQVESLPVEIGGPGLVFDPVHNEMVLFGGGLNSGMPNGATYRRRGTVWSVASTTGPEPVANLGLCWVERLGQVLLFGGSRGNPDGEVDSCWTWNGATWLPLTDAGRPTRRQSMGFVYDTSRERAISLFGFLNNTNTYLAEQWELSFSTMELTLQPTSVTASVGQLTQFSCTSPSATTYLWRHNNTPLSNNAHISGADTAALTITNTQWSDQGSYTCLVSGNCGSVMSDAATLTVTSCPPSWASFGTADFGARWVHAQAYSGVNGSTLVFGGRNATGQSLGDTWLKSASGWSNVSTSGPAARTDHALAPLANGRVLLFGGKTAAAVNNSALGDTWEWDGAQWNLLSTTGPQARAGHAMCFDSSRNRVVLYGGLDLNGLALGDTWEWNGSAWSQVSTTGPAPRFAHTMAFDPVRGETLVFGGYVNGLRSDTWAWNGSSWREAATSGVSARFYAAADFDAQLGRVLLFGGSAGGSVLGDAYVWTGAAWQPQAFGTSPTPRWTHAMSYDAAAQRMVITGGAGSGATRFADSWAESGRAIVTSQPEAAMSRMAGDTVRLANTVAGTGPFTYRWKKGGANLFNSSIYGGVTTPTLTINTKDPSQSGLYTLAITSPCTVTTTPGTALEVYCGADWNNDGGIDGDDVILFFDQWDNGSIEADFTGDGSVDGDDVIGFFGRWDAGC